MINKQQPTLLVVVKAFEINEENQFIDFWLITRSGKNHAFIPLRQQLQPTLLVGCHE